MSEEEQSKLFKRYYRGTNTTQNPEGSGLGLAIANQIVALHAGKITISGSHNYGISKTL